MVLSIPQTALLAYVRAQLDHFFPDGYDFCGSDVNAAFRLALDRMENSMKAVEARGYHDEEGNTTFSHLHADQYAQFIYFLGNSLWTRSQNKPLCDKLLQLNRVLFSIFISYKCPLPEHFLLGHPIGTILGNAVYHDFLVVTQGVTVNTNEDEEGNPAPVLGKGLFLGAGAKIIGSQPVGDRVSIGVNAMVHQQKIPDDSVVICDKGGCSTVMKRKSRCCAAQYYFNVTI